MDNIELTETKLSTHDLVGSLITGFNTCVNLLNEQRNKLQGCNDDKSKIDVYRQIIETLDEMCEASESVSIRLESEYPDDLVEEGDEDEEGSDSEPYVTKLVKERKEKKAAKPKVEKPKCSFVLQTGKNKNKQCQSNAVKDSNLCSKHNK